MLWPIILPLVNGGRKAWRLAGASSAEQKRSALTLNRLRSGFNGGVSIEGSLLSEGLGVYEYGSLGGDSSSCFDGRTE